MTNNTDHFEYMFLPGWPKNVAVIFSIFGYLVSAAFFYGVSGLRSINPIF